MAEQATVIRFREETSKEKLTFWLADKLDELMFLTLSGRAYTLKTDGTTRVISASAAEFRRGRGRRLRRTHRSCRFGHLESTLTANDKMSWSVIVATRPRPSARRSGRSAAAAGLLLHHPVVGTAPRSGVGPDLPDHHADRQRQGDSPIPCSPAPMRWSTG